MNTISTHTLRGERDVANADNVDLLCISTHTLRGERDKNNISGLIHDIKFQLTRSVGSVTTKTTKKQTKRAISTHTLRGERDNTNENNKNNSGISTHTLRGERDSTYCICEVTSPQQSGHFIKNHFKKRYFFT